MSTVDTGFISNFDVAAVAELAVEPSYISEIARKLQEAGEPYSGMTLNAVIRIVSRSAFAMAEEGRLTVERPALGGQIESSPKSTITGEGFAQTNEWKEYTVIRSGTDMAEVRPEFRPMVDFSMTINRKLDMVDMLSRMGNEVAQLSEDILQDQIRVFDFDFIEESEYNQPGLDVYIEGDGIGYGIEISTRWVNAISGNYVSHKMDLVADKEQERGVPVDLMIMAPRFTDRERRKREDDDIVTLSRLPEDVVGNPVIISDFSRDSSGMGPGYPLVEDGFEEFQENLNNVMRQHGVIQEREYRDQITSIVGEFIGQ